MAYHVSCGHVYICNPGHCLSACISMQQFWRSQSGFISVDTMHHQDAVNIGWMYRWLLTVPCCVYIACRGVGREPIYVDLEAEPKIDRDNPPDLKQYADSIEPPPKEDDGPSSSSNSGAQAAAAGAAAGAAAAKPAAAAAAVAGKSSKKAAAAGSAAKGNGKMSNDAHHIKLTNVVQRTVNIVDMVSEWESRGSQLVVPLCWFICSAAVVACWNSSPQSGG